MVMTDTTKIVSLTGQVVAVFVDCNCFLQLRDLKDLPWRELLPGVRQIDLMVMPTVLTELDQKKVEPKDRIRNRARAAIKQIDAASERDPMRMRLRDKPVEVSLCLPEVPRTDWSRYPKLDPSRPDDQLVAQAMDTCTDLDKVLLSHDSGPRVAARRCGLTAKAPPATWLLPDPIDDDRRKIQQLQRDNAALLARHPQVVASWGAEHAGSGHFKIQRLVTPCLGGDAITALVKRCEQLWPLQTGILRMGQGFFIGDDDTSGEASQDEYERYVTKWGKWRDRLYAFFENLHEQVAASSRIAAAELFYENVGSATASRLMIGFSVSEGWLVLSDEREVDLVAPPSITVTAPPLTPFQQKHKNRATKADEVSLQIRAMLPHREPPHDPTGFYWIERTDDDGRSGRYECAEFRAKAKQMDKIWLMPKAEPPCPGRLTVNIHASNLSEPIDLDLPLMFEDRQANWSDPVVTSLLDSKLAAMIKDLV